MSESVNTPADPSSEPRERAKERPGAAEVASLPRRSTPGRTVSDKVMGLIETLATSAEPLRLATLAEATDTSKATCHRLLADLCEQGFARGLGAGRYAVGPRLRGLAATITRHDPMVELVEDALDELARRSGQLAVHSCLLPDGRWVVLATAAAGRQLQVVRPGQVLSPQWALGRTRGGVGLIPDQPIPGTWALSRELSGEPTEMISLVGHRITPADPQTHGELVDQVAELLDSSRRAGTGAGTGVG